MESESAPRTAKVYVQSLRRLPLLEDLPDEDLAALAARGRVAAFRGRGRSNAPG